MKRSDVKKIPNETQVLATVSEIASDRAKHNRSKYAPVFKYLSKGLHKGHMCANGNEVRFSGEMKGFGGYSLEIPVKGIVLGSFAFA